MCDFLVSVELKSRKRLYLFSKTSSLRHYETTLFFNHQYITYVGGEDEDQAENIGEEESLSNLSNVTGKRAGKCHYNGCVTGIVA